jgi:starvation-inducible DNA-binding protein
MLKTHNYHWNVEGPLFHALHEMFQDQYEDLFAAVDDIAEQIRSLGHKAPGKFSTYAEHSDLVEGDEEAGAMDMVIDLAKDNEALARRLRDGVDRAMEAGDEGSADLMIARMQQHTKNAWMLRATASDKD